MHSCASWSMGALLLWMSFAAWAQDPATAPPVAPVAPVGTVTDPWMYLVSEALRLGGFPAAVLMAAAWYTRGKVQNLTLTVRLHDDDMKRIEHALQREDSHRD